MTPNEMAAKILSEKVLGLAQAGNRFPAHRGKGRISPVTIWRWVSQGVRTPDGRHVHLEAVRLGGRWLTSEEALIRFAAAQTPQTDAESSPCAPEPTLTQHRHAAQEAGK